MENEEGIYMSEDKRYLTMMWVNKISMLDKLSSKPPLDLQEMVTFIENKVEPTEVAVIYHTNDIDDKGKPVDPHMHAVLKFKNKQSLDKIAEKLGELPQNIQKWDGRTGNAYSYLIHRTAESSKKYQYSPEEVKANFDFVKKISEIEKKLSKKRKESNEVNNLLNQYGERKISKEELYDKLTPFDRAKNKVYIDRISDVLKEEEKDQFIKYMKENDKKIKTLYFYGETATGKTRCSELLLSEIYGSYYSSGSNRDPFAGYDNEKAIILEELRPETVSYNELLTLTDPFHYKKSVGSRYHDKNLIVENIIINTPFSPNTFYRKCFDSELNVYVHSDDNTIKDISFEDQDSAEQLFRRINVFKFDYEYIYKMEFNKEVHSYKVVDKIKNIFSSNSSEIEINDKMIKFFGIKKAPLKDA